MIYFKNKRQLYRFVCAFMERKEMVEELSSLLPLDELEFSKVKYLFSYHAFLTCILATNHFQVFKNKLVFNLCLYEHAFGQSKALKRHAPSYYKFLRNHFSTIASAKNAVISSSLASPKKKHDGKCRIPRYARVNTLLAESADAVIRELQNEGWELTKIPSKAKGLVFITFFTFF